MAAQRCVNTQCSKFAKRESVYCGTDCIHQHAKDSLRVLNRYDAKRGKAVSTDRHTVNQLLFVCEKFFARFVRALLLQIFFRHRPVFAIYYSCNKKNTGVDIALLWKVVTAIQFISGKLRNKVVVNNGWFTVIVWPCPTTLVVTAKQHVTMVIVSTCMLNYKVMVCWSKNFD